MTHAESIVVLTDVMAKFTSYIGKHLPTDVEAKLRELRAKETKPLAMAIYHSMADNQEAAAKLQTVMERLLDEVSFLAPDRSGETVLVDAGYVEKHVGALAKNADLSKFIL